MTPVILYFLKTKVGTVKGTVLDKGPILIAAHHEHLADQFIVGLPIRRSLFWVADITPPGSKKSFADMRFRKWLLARLGAVPIDKNNPSRNSNLFEYLLFLLEKGKAIVFFPESYIKKERDNEKFGHFKDGVVRLALEYEKKFNRKVPIYPIGLKYDKGIANLNIGKPVFVSKRADRDILFDEIKRLTEDG